ncbi:MAG TPA: transcriptional regulator, partial [Erysipelotrichaceae bacterium]|nr:transcriptional regulator [Erysipelotrichaceae bacterium]
MKPIQEEEITDLADLFKIFSDSTRLRILFSLMDGEKNVTELTQDLDMTQSNV